MGDINLLPTELAPKGSFLRIVSMIKKLTVVMLVLMVMFLVSSAGYIFYLNTQIGNLEKSAVAIKDSIAKLEQSEQKLFLLKDRVGKIALILQRQGEDRQPTNLETLLGVTTEVTYSNLKVTPTISVVTVTSTTSLGLAHFLENLLTKPEYHQVKLLAINFDELKGYVLDLEVSEK